MKRFLTLLMSFIYSFGFSQSKSLNFKLVERIEQSDINYLIIKKFNYLPPGYEGMLKSFKPVKGEFTTYTFIKTFDGESKYNGNKKNHDLIIIKTDSTNKVLDGFYYRLEWEEVPSQYILFRSFSVDLILKDKLKISELNFLNEYEMYNNQTEAELRRLACCSNDILSF